MSDHWYALSCKLGKEEVLCNQLLAQGFDVFFPRICSISENSKGQTWKPFFPGYIFVRFNPEIIALSTFQWMQNSTGVVCIGGKPSHVPDKMIQAIQKRFTGVYSGSIAGSNNTAGCIVEEQESPSHLFYDALLNFDVEVDERTRALVQMIGEANVSSETNLS